MNEVQEKTQEQTHDDIINAEIEAEHKEARKELSETEVLTERIRSSQKQKQAEFVKAMKENQNKRLYSTRIVIEFSELIDIDKNSLRYEENEEDYKFNNDLMKEKSRNFDPELLQFLSVIQNVPNVSIEQVAYLTRPYQKKCNCGPDIKVEAIGLENAPKAVQDFVKNLKNLSNCSCDSCDD